MHCCCDASVVSYPPSALIGGVTLTCPSVNVTPSITRLDGAGSITVLAGTAMSVSVTVISGPVSIQIGSDPVVSLPGGMAMGWSVEACTQTLSEDIVVTTTQPGHTVILSQTL